jgi:hypothetical protein
MVKLISWPFALLAGFISARLGRSLFRKVWSKIDDSPPPEPGTGEGTMLQVVGAQALQAAIMAGVTAGVHRASAKTFNYLIGAWPDKPASAEED